MLLALVVNIIVILAITYYIRKHMNISNQDMNKLWCGYFLIMLSKDISSIIVGVLTMSSAAIISGLVGALITGVFLWYFAKSAELI
jgi:hypothetical protein